MNMQRRSEERSLTLHREIARKLRDNPTLWQIPKENVSRWKERSSHLSPALREWEYILNTKTHEQILAILEGDTEESVRLRSSSPFTGILSAVERATIFESFRKLEKVDEV